MSQNVNRKTKMNPNENALDVNFIEVANFLYSSKSFVLLASLIAAIAVGFWGAFIAIPNYVSSTAILYSVKVSDGIDIGTANSYWAVQSEMENKFGSINTQMLTRQFRTAVGQNTLKSVSPDVRDGLTADRKTIQDNIPKSIMDNPKAIGDYVMGHVNITLNPQTKVIGLSAKAVSPKLSKALANVAAYTLMDQNYQGIIKELNNVSDFISDQLQSVQVKLYGLEDQLAAIQSREKILSINDTSSRMDNIKYNQTKVIQDLMIEKRSLAYFINELESNIKGFKKNLFAGNADRLYFMELQSRLSLLSYQKKVEQQGRAPSSISSDELKKTVDELKLTMSNMQDVNLTMDPIEYLSDLEKTLSASKRKLSEVNTQVKANQKEQYKSLASYGVLPEVLKRISQLQRNIKVTSDLYQQLKTKQQETQIRRAGKKNNMSIMNPADHGARIGLGLWKLMLFSFVGSLFVLIVVLTLRYLLIPTIRSRTDLKNSGAEVIAEVPYARSLNGNSKEKKSRSDIHNLVLDASTVSDEANAVRQARFRIQQKLNLHMARKNKEAKVLTVCSASSKEGKSFITANVAHSLALAQFNVLVIDLDMLNPSQRGYYLNEPSRNNQAYGDKYKFELTVVNSYLTIATLPSTEEIMADILESPLLENFINEMKKNYDVVLIDTPPLRNSLEPLIACRHSDAAIFVASQRSSLRHDVYRSMETLMETYDNEVLGVLNFSYDELNASRRRITAA